MSKEPRGAGRGGLVAGAPYQKSGSGRESSSSVVAAAAAPSVTTKEEPQYPYVDANTLHRFPRRVKPLPPDRNDAAIGGMQLLQLEQHVQFRCVRCRKDRIIADCFAADAHGGHFQCVRCFTRLIRPKQFRPTRVVPFPSLLSWLNYRPQDVMTNVDDATQRPADIVAPSGHRVATEQHAAQSLHAITESAMTGVVGGAFDTRSAEAQRAAGVATASGPKSAAGTHPCLRVWGACVHGDATCMFASAPGNLCIAFLMGLCAHGDECPLLHQRVLDLPDSIEADLPPPPRYANAAHPDAGKFSEWVARRAGSRNGAEWQLYNNGPLDGLFNQYLPAAVADEPPQVGSAAPPVKLSATSITGALRKLREQQQTS